MQDLRPDSRGYSGAFGGRFVPETVMSALYELEQAYDRMGHDGSFQQTYETLLRDFVGRRARQGGRKARSRSPQRTPARTTS